MRQEREKKPYRDIKELELLLARNLEKSCRTPSNLSHKREACRKEAVRPRGLRKKAASMPKLPTKAAGELKKGLGREGVGHQAHQTTTGDVDGEIVPCRGTLGIQAHPRTCTIIILFAEISLDYQCFEFGLKIHMKNMEPIVNIQVVHLQIQN